MPNLQKEKSMSASMSMDAMTPICALPCLLVIVDRCLMIACLSVSVVISIPMCCLELSRVSTIAVVVSMPFVGWGKELGERGICFGC